MILMVKYFLFFNIGSFIAIWPKKTLKMQKKKKQMRVKKSLKLKNGYMFILRTLKKLKTPNFEKVVIASGYMFY